MKRLKQSPTLGPLLRLVEDYRVICEIPSAILAQGLGVTRLSYYLWLAEKTKPTQHNIRTCKIVGAAMKRAYENQELPIHRSSSLTKGEREAKIRDVLFRYIGNFSERAS